MRAMTTREQVHKLVDALPESELEPVAEILASRGANGTAATGAKKVGRLSFFAIGEGDPPDAARRVDEFVGRAIDRRHPTA
jgi:hypothetical protein